jgi:hypothetical protein
MYEKTGEITQIRDLSDITLIDPIKVEGEGILYAKWSPKDKNGFNIGPTLGVFTSPENLPGATFLDTALVRKAVDAIAKRTIDKKGVHTDHIPPFRGTFNKVAKHLSGVKNWHGHNGSNFRSEEEFKNAVWEGDFLELEKWNLPPRKLAEALFLQREKGALASTFTRVRGGDTRQAYATLSTPGALSTNRLAIDFRNGEIRSALPDQTELYARPIRIIPVLD